MSDENDEVTKVAHSRRSRFGCLFYAGMFLLVFGTGLVIFLQRWRASASKELRTEMDRVVARGEPLWFADLAPRPADPDDDATPLYLAAVAQLRAPSQAFRSLVAPETPASQSKPGNYEIIAEELAENRPALELLRRALLRPYFRLPLDYRTSRPISLLLEPVQKAREFSLLLSAEVLQSIGTGEIDRAFDALLDQLQFAELMRDEPIMITQLVRTAIAAQAIHSMETVLAYVELTPEQFHMLDERLAQMQREFQLAPSVRGERAMLLTTISTLGENADDMDAFLGTGMPIARILSSSGLGPMRMSEAAYTLRVMSDIADAVDLPGEEGHAAVNRLHASLGPSLKHVLTRSLAPHALQTRETGLQHRQRIINARIALRVRRFHQEHGEFASSLDRITDDSLPTIPNDLLAGKPPIYRVWPDGFAIYVAGENGVDDGGGEHPDPQESASKVEVQLPRRDD